MAGNKKDIRLVIRLKSIESDHIYYTQKNCRNHLGRLELRQDDPILRKHLFKETK